ncbi:unnamed protein product [Sphenostylis stenocarpa]|uniref:Purple acid phosphatase n=1 Tax=Sphenostylis stenocarpa TaxID=92480 RepID=A0AA86RXZ8_9FABA|nr:unnamed protein product [Sphenostylis stenocarpa]
MINRKFLNDCSASNPFINVNVTSNSTLSDDGFVTVTVTGVSNPSNDDWVAMISPSISESTPLSFSNPKRPLYGHLSSIDSSGTSMRLTWVSGDKEPQQIQYANGKSVNSTVTTFSQADMCSSLLPSPAKDFGWHDPGYIHSAVMTGLIPLSTFSYRYGSDSVGWSKQIMFSTPPVGGSDELRFIAFGDMGKTPLDASEEHYIQPGALSVIKAIANDVNSNKINSVFHIGDISYATGFLAEWDFFLHLINPVASRISYMTAIGNHERDYVNSGSIYITPDSGGECGVPYEKYFPMPTSAKDKPWYSIEQGSIHFTVISTEHDWSENSEQYEWMQKDMASVNRQKTPWLIFTGHRQMYSSTHELLSSSTKFIEVVEPLLFQNKVRGFLELDRGEWEQSVDDVPSLLDIVIANTTVLHRNFTALSEFRMVNRRILGDCSASNPFLEVNVISNSSLSDDEFVTVTVTGVANPSDGDWVAMISPSNSEQMDVEINSAVFDSSHDAFIGFTFTQILEKPLFILGLNPIEKLDNLENYKPKILSPVSGFLNDKQESANISD